MKILFLLSSALTLASSLSFDKELNSQCSSDFTGDNGICLEAKNCSAFPKSRNKLQICSFNRRVPIVCCPRQLDFRQGQKRISAQKCEEYSSPNLSKKIDDGVQHIFFIGGVKAVVNEFPHMSAIGWRLDGAEISWKCGGSLISENFVVSAAHCVTSRAGKPNVVRIGDLDLLNDNDGAFPQEFGIKNIFIHPNYTRSMKYHDIVLFELDRNASFSDSVRPACLHQGEDFSKYTTTAMGWGQTSFGGKPSSTLMKGDLTIVSTAECNESYGEEIEIPKGITNDQICAWDPNGERDTCQGDSGGPLQISENIEGTSKKFFKILGITSFGKYCAAGIPGVYVKISSYLDWIERIVWPNNL